MLLLLDVARANFRVNPYDCGESPHRLVESDSLGRGVRCGGPRYLNARDSLS